MSIIEGLRKAYLRLRGIRKEQEGIVLVVINGESCRIKEAKERVLLSRTQQDGGMIEAFDFPRPRKLLFDEEVRHWFVGTDEAELNKIFLVDAIALYHENKIVAYRITKVHKSFVPEY